jgi:RNA polymerase sigma factor (sigma-70 family)
MMPAVDVPPFERFYEEHRAEVLRRLTRLLGRQEAEDAFSETFVRALRAYGGLRDASNLRAWILTIAARVAIDHHRRRPPEHGGGAESVAAPVRPAYAELAPLADRLPPTERAAVVLRYGYDLPYAEIAAALGSSEAAARQAASAGVRRLRRAGARVREELRA